ncbi:glycosyltransferase family 2 protein [Paenibacillus glycinis]|uniref:Glycosyltransferase n=1 Tax=Paenibacillus glycinis TaxID=2697035 RepID=A0ABW9XRN2_9BACL|nr:glycosyltransferase family 2 protein [Paenibacillus glycinis]NBD25325.1 glycosyltransferase [Paenibacillus glycinis]
MLLGIHVLACNEEDVLGRCLQSVRGLADEIVVTDTGSGDRTVDIAKAYGARIVRAAWEDDFAAARNAGLEAARTVWVLVLDADEWLEAGYDRTSLRRMLREAQEDGFSVRMESRYGHEANETLSHEAMRLFRADCGLRYAGAIHEQLVRPGARKIAVDGPLCGLRLRHDGYLPEMMARKAKAERNLRLIGKALREEPDHPFHLYNRGVTLCQLNKPKDACAAFALASLFAPADAPYRASLVRDRAKALLAIGDADGAAAMLHREVDRYADCPDVQLAYGDSLMAQRRALEARGAYEAALAAGAAAGGSVREAGAGSFRARCGIAAAEAALGRAEHALRAYAAAAAEAPRYGPALAGWAEQLQAVGENDEAIRAALASSLGEAAPGDAALLARVLGGIGAYAAALPLWREAKPLAPAEIRAYAAALAGAGDAGAARALLLGWLEAPRSAKSVGAAETETAAAVEGTAANRRQTDAGFEHAREGVAADIAQQLAAGAMAEKVTQMQTQAPATARQQHPLFAALCADAALCGWEAGMPLGGTLREMLASAHGELAERLSAVERYAAPYVAVRSARTPGADAGLPEWLPFVGLLLERALELGLPRLAGRLAQAAPALNERYGVTLYRHGYAQAAAGRLLRGMEQRAPGAEESFAFGEILLLKGLYGEALSMFEAAMPDEGVGARAKLGAAFCSLALAREALLPWAERATAEFGGGWPLADLEQLQLAIIRTEATGWRTPWTAVQRRRMNVGEHEADHALHDR